MKALRIVLSMMTMATGFGGPLGGHPLRGQEPSQEPLTTLRLSTRVVAVAAVVVDGNGSPVRGLDKAEFVLKQDGKEQPIRYFSEDMDLPLTLALMVDTSGSEKAYLQEEVIASEAFFKAMLRRTTDRAALFQFDAGVRQLRAMTSSLETLENSLSYLTLPHGATMDAGRGGTRLYDAITAAGQASLGRERGRRAMVILTDGEDNGSTSTLGQAVAAAQKADAVVYSVLIGDAEKYGPTTLAMTGHARGSDVMREISGATGGRVFVVSRQLRLREIYEQIEEDMRLQYQIGYTPPEAAPGSYHKIELKVIAGGAQTGHKLAVQVRKGFYTPQS